MERQGQIININRVISMAMGRVAIFFLMSVVSVSAFAFENPIYSIYGEVGAVWQSRNDTQIPTEGGTFFEFDRLGRGPFPHVRIEAHARWPASPHGLRLILAPLQLRVKGDIDDDVTFDGQVFPANQPTEVGYRFNSYRLGYVYHGLGSDSQWWRVGGTLKVRDAEIEVAQPGKRQAYSNVGVVPLIYAGARWSVAEDVSLDADTDFAWAPQGRAMDAAIKVQYHLDAGETLSMGVRSLEGGAANERVTGWAWLNYVVVGYTLETLQ